MSNSTISDQSLMDKSMRSVFVGNIPYEATEENLKDIFSEVGPVLSFKLVFDRETGKPKGYGFCEYKDQETALSAMRNLNGYEIGGRTLRVDNACTEKSRMEMQSLLQGQNTENPYGEAVQADKAPEAISKAVASLPPEQMFELMKQMKLCVQNNPNEARQMLLQNPQLAYALLQAQVVMRIVDPQTAVNMLHKANPIPGVILPNDKPPLHPIVPRIEEPWTPRPAPTPVNPPAPIFAGQDVDLRTLDRQIDPRLARMDQDLRGPPQVPPVPVSAPVIAPPSDPRAVSQSFALPEPTLPAEGIESFGRDPRADRFGREPRDPRDPRMPVDPRIPKINPPAPGVTSVAPRPIVATPVPPPTTSGINPTNPLSLSTPSTATSRLMAGMSPAGNIPSGASDQEKAALIMQVLQLSDEQIAMLPPEQRQSILVLKEQIAKSTQR
ncbi:cleavage stimulation factor subunit 2 isoform X1 [Neodiprion pinetum]|uniref:Cleavage stimulation factor subunit 2 isoform X1 n=1 Tax=Neodiprion lecontei TaxID=441921 RepID=A0A6J0BUP4_NEOLC|nr:cleavage stimulation factor subunit 2 isoform X1 [Neodiprion lecontei]XP_046419477.1 cleavage stimulation factor subunit 2 isoform X1 [Neodiprion fabricii]XP_046478496.1 cleavage stimulation factor subunit 2 isoform X1 [Neodiprion pinetum]XP_046611537.1 cleavage stimulation factor subunit 2 isoform X1 [Neodiprion virginianus]